MKSRSKSSQSANSDVAIIGVLHTERPFYWIVVGIPAFALATVLLPAAAGMPVDFASWIASGIMAIMCIYAFFWGKTTTLSLSHDAIHYRSLLHRVDIALVDVVGVEYATGFVAFSYKPYKRIVVTVRKGPGDEEIVLNAGLFSPREIMQWVKECNSRIKGN